MNRRYLLVMLAVCISIGCVQAWGADMGAWNYRKEITINNTGANLTNYQVLFTVNRSAGSDSGFTTYLDGKCESDYDDIRFTTSDENTLCDYWIESNSSTVASIWVEVPSIVNSTAYGSTTLYLYYGNSGASAVSNGANTFVFFDDFNGISVNTTIWNKSSNVPTTETVSGGVYTCHNTNTDLRGIYSKTEFGTNTAVRSLTKTIGYNYPLIGYDKRLAGTNNWVIMVTAETPSSGNYRDALVTKNSGETYTSNAAFTKSDNWFVYDIVRNGVTGYASLYRGGSLVATTNSNVPSSSLPVIIATQSDSASESINVDWFAVRSYTATEPTVSAWGSEEESPVGHIVVDFSGVPTSGYVPLTVYFTDASVGYNVTIDTWSWSFGDTTPNSTSQNPAHTYTTSGLYTVGLTATNTSFSKTNSTTKTAYINATVNLDAPNADFTVTETCGDVSDTFYFIDFSTGGGLYAWNWSFGDGQYSELRNPTHQYSSNGTYDVGLTVWGAYGNDTLTRSNLITIPCGAPTPTPTGTPTGNVTPTGTPGNVTEGNITYIYAPDQDYVPFPIWLAIVIVSIALFGHSIIFLRNSDLTAMMAAVFAFVSAWLSNMIGYIDVQVTYIAEEILISPVIQAVHPPWLVYTMLLFALVSVVNIFAAIYKVYLKPTPWNEIYNRKLPKWRNR